MVVRVICKALGFALGKLGFWASAVFAAVYGACCLWAGLTFNTYWFCAGLLASWVLGLTVSLAVIRSKYKPDVKAEAVEPEKTGRDLGAVKSAQPDVTLKRKSAGSVREAARTHPAAEDMSPERLDELKEKYIYDKTSSEKSRTSEAEKLYHSEKERLWKQLETKSVETAPLVFATRKDPDIFIYEYPDKLQFYRRSGQEMILLSTEYKQQKELKKD